MSGLLVSPFFDSQGGQIKVRFGGTLRVRPTGERFVNELGNRKNSAEAVLNVHRQKLRALAIGNHISKERLDAIRHGFMDEMLSFGLIDQYGSLEEIERAWNMPSGRLVATVEHYNKSLKSHRDRDFSDRFNATFR